MNVKRVHKFQFHPFEIINYGDFFSVQRGLVVKVDSGQQFEVDGLKHDLKYEPLEAMFPVGTSVYLTIAHDDPSTLDKATSVNINSVYITTSSETSAGVTSIKIGDVTGELVTQELRSDFYFNIYGTQ